VYINIAFENKDAAKLLGAKWDLKNKKWFYYNNIPVENKEKLKNLEEKKVTQIVIPKNYLNINYAKKNIAKSYGAKWDIVEKKWYYLDTLDEINKQKLKEL
jgi:PhoPQ-activated pathogenicity-related protein